MEENETGEGSRADFSYFSYSGDVRWGSVISTLKREDTWDFHQVLISVFHRGGVRNGVELVRKWGGGGTPELLGCFSEVQHQERLMSAISTGFWGKAGQVFPRFLRKARTRSKLLILLPSVLSQLEKGRSRSWVFAVSACEPCSHSWGIFLEMDPRATFKDDFLTS